ncbi:MAG: hypothetical protein ACI9S8_000735 [Chlamydiales bacterium]|jgi:hypothetical protein
MLKIIFKAFTYIIILILILTSVLATFVWIERVSLMKRMLTKAFGVSVEMESVDVSLEGLEMRSLRIFNPKGIKRPFALEADVVSLKMNFLNLLNDPIEVNDVILDEVKLFMEMLDASGKKTNWTPILNNLDPNAELEESDGMISGNRRRVVIKNLQVKNMKFEVKHPVLGTTDTKIKNIQLADIGRGGKLSSKQAIRFIIRAMIGYVTKIPKFHEILKNVLKLPKDLFKGIFFPGQDPQVKLEIGTENKKGDPLKESPIKPGLIETSKKADKFMKKLKPFDKNIEK